MLTFIDFFAGIGGFRRGMELAGHKCIGFCEFDKFAMASYTAMHCMTDEDSSMEGGGLEPSVILPAFCDMSYGAGLEVSETAFSLQARYNKGVCGRKGETSGVAVPVLTPERVEKRQNGRRFKENGEAMFTLTAQDRHGVMIELPDGGCAYAVWCEKYKCYVAIRRLTTKECFRLQGWEDVYFERAALVNSDSQLYRQAGNGVTVPVIRAIAERMEI